MFKSINGGIFPQRATKFSAGFDVYSNEDVVIGAGETKLIGLGITLDLDYTIADSWAQKFFFPPNKFIDLAMDSFLEFMEIHYFALHIRSSLRAKGLTSLGTGVIDMDYRDEIKMVIHNPLHRTDFGYGSDGEVIKMSSHYEINKGDKIGQLILCRHEGWLLPIEYTKDEERNGGFGSTDKGNK